MGSLLFAALLVLFWLTPARAQSPAARPLKEQVTALQTQVAKLQAQLATLQSQVGQMAALQTTVTMLQQQIHTLSGLSAIGPYLSLETIEGHPTVRFTGVNVQIVNGTGSTATVNGAGNLIVGYDESDKNSPFVCSNGKTPAQQSCVLPDVWSNNQRTGSHNLVIGVGHTYTSYGGMVVGFASAITNSFATVSGGGLNVASGPYGSVSGGDANRASGGNSSVSGGYQNTASGQYSSVSGGAANNASGYLSSISGGILNDHSSPSSAAGPYPFAGHWQYHLSWGISTLPGVEPVSTTGYGPYLIYQHCSHGSPSKRQPETLLR